MYFGPTEPEKFPIFAIIFIVLYLFIIIYLFIKPDLSVISRPKYQKKNAEGKNVRILRNHAALKGLIRIQSVNNLLINLFRLPVIDSIRKNDPDFGARAITSNFLFVIRWAI